MSKIDAPSTRASFLERLKDSNDQRAWKAFVELYKPTLDRWCRKTLHHADADDACSLALEKIWAKIRTFQYDPSGSFRGWLRKLVHRVVLDYLRAQSRRPDARGSGNPHVQQALQQLEAASDGTLEDQHLDALEAKLEQLRQAMLRVEARAQPQTWQAWLLCEAHDRPAKEVAEQLGMKVASVYKAKQRIREMIQEEFSRAADSADLGGTQ
jgi:RNA polymerase sigma-70 factor (ECF subfamily)